MTTKRKILCAVAFLLPCLLALWIWDTNGDIYELKVNMQMGQFLQKKDGKPLFPEEYYPVQHYLDENYMDADPTPGNSRLVFAKRNPDLPNYSVFMRFLGTDPEDMKALYSQILLHFQGVAGPLLGQIGANRKSELSAVTKSIVIIENMTLNRPKTLRDGESFANIRKELISLKGKKEFLELSLSEKYMFNFKSLNEPSIKKKRDSDIFLLTLVGGALFVALFLSYTLARIPIGLKGF